MSEPRPARRWPRRVVILGAGGRDFHDFAMAYRGDPTHRVVAFTAAQIPGIADRRFPADLAGPGYPDGIPIVAEDGLDELLRDGEVDEVVLAYSDLSHPEVMHLASRALAAGADFRLLGPRTTELEATSRVVAVVATRTGCGKSQTARAVAAHLRAAGRAVVLVRHPMPYGDLGGDRVQRFVTLADVDAARPTIEEREEFEAAVRMGVVMYAGIEYAEVVAAADAEAEVIVWDGGNNDQPFLRPDVLVCVADARRPGDGRSHHPGEANLRRADVVVVNKVDAADARPEEAVAVARELNPGATIVRTASPVTLDDGPPLAGRRVLVVEDGPTLTHGGAPDGAGAAAARAAGAVLVDPRDAAVGSLATTLARHPHIGPVLPAMGYGAAQLADLAATIAAVDCDAVVVGTPADLGRLIEVPHPLRRVTYRSVDAGEPTLGEVIDDRLGSWP